MLLEAKRQHLLLYKIRLTVRYKAKKLPTKMVERLEDIIDGVCQFYDGKLIVFQDHRVKICFGVDVNQYIAIGNVVDEFKKTAEQKIRQEFYYDRNIFATDSFWGIKKRFF